jgi:hypothetical protein
VVATTVLRTELAEQMEALEVVLAELPGINAEEVRAVSGTEGGQIVSQGAPRLPRADPIGTSRYAVEFCA